MYRIGMLFFILLFFSKALLFSQVADSENKTSIPEPKSFITDHEIEIADQMVKFKAIAKESYLKNDKGEEIASFWNVSYIKTDVSDPKNRPVMFIFNGGPGSASMWLHMGMFGPQLVKVQSDAMEDDGAAPYNLKINTHSLLDLTDLVFIDPVGTGYSRAIGNGKNEDFWGLNEDANSVAQFIRHWITENQRWFSPKYIAGESFGTTRAAAVANALEGNGQNMALNGLILISQALDYAGSTSTNDNITSYLTYLPSMAATAWYHKKAGIDKSLEEFVQEARDFTYDEYAPALYRGALLKEDEKRKIAERLAYFTSLDSEYILKSDNRILMRRFQKQLLFQEGLSVGRLDGRFMGNEIDKVSEGPHLGDPAGYQISAAYTAALNYYFAEFLEVKMDRPYLTSNRNIGRNWNWKPVGKNSPWEPHYVNVSRRLAETMKRNPEMKVMVAAGYFDLICPFFDAEYTFSRNGIDPQNIQIEYYEAGHMMYTREEDFIKLSEDIRGFLKD